MLGAMQMVGRLGARAARPAGAARLVHQSAAPAAAEGAVRRGTGAFGHHPSQYATKGKKPKINRKTPVKATGTSVHTFEKTTWLGARQGAVDKGYFAARPELEDKDDFFSGEFEKVATLGPEETFQQLFTLSPATLRTANVLEATFPGQRRELFAEQATLVRDYTLEVLSLLRGVREGDKIAGYCFLGGAGAGKSTALLQTVAMGRFLGFLSIHLPSAEALVDGRTPFVHNEAEQAYDQPAYVHKLLKRVLAAHPKELLAGAQLTAKRSLRVNRATTIDLDESHTLHDLVVAGAKNRPAAVAAFKALLHELSVERENAIPVVLTMDRFNALTRTPYSEYRDADNKPVYYADLALPKLFVEYLTGKRSFHRGITFAATSSIYPLNETARVGFRYEPAGAYTSKKSAYDAPLANTLLGVNTLEIAPYSLEETEKMLRYYVASKVVYGIDDDIQRFVFGEPPLLRQQKQKAQELMAEKRFAAPRANGPGFHAEDFAGTTLFSGDALRQAVAESAEDGLAPADTAVVDECKENRHALWWKSFVDTKFLVSGGGAPRALLDSCCMRAD
ncbi:mitochondrial 37S ribosomal protein mS29 [Dipodascopsis tothii]|uniref:mitochondrial 37S ribosomal protein mS29 n=1 Tax=Dipodascopsis tothii TaxID=44089 RepID=UPI0034CD1D14